MRLDKQCPRAPPKRNGDPGGLVVAVSMRMVGLDPQGSRGPTVGRGTQMHEGGAAAPLYPFSRTQAPTFEPGSNGLCLQEPAFSHGTKNGRTWLTVLPLATDLHERQLAASLGTVRLLRCLKATCLPLCDREKRGQSAHQDGLCTPTLPHCLPRCLPRSLGCEPQRGLHLHLVRRHPADKPASFPTLFCSEKIKETQ